MRTASELPAPVADALGRWLARHEELAPDLIDGLYVVGSAALDDWRPGSDVDIVAFTSRAVTNDDVVALRTAHEAAASDSPSIDVDGPRLRWADVAEASRPVVRPWTLGDDFRHDDECFECHPVTWRTLARHGVAVRGPAVADLAVHDDDRRVNEFVRENTDSYWRGVADQIEQELASSPDRGEFDAPTVAWTVLGAARMLFTARTGGVASKTVAGRWVSDELPAHRPVADLAIGIRHDPSPPPVDRAALGDTVAFVRRVGDEVAATECA